MKKFLALFVITSFTSLLQADMSSNQGGYYQGQPQQTPYQGGQPQNRTYQGGGSSNQPTTRQTYGYSQSSGGGVSDSDIKSQIQDALKSSNKYSNVTVSVDNGVATLKGSVNSPDDKVALGALVGGIDGIKSVSNQVTVKGEGGSSSGYGGTPQGYGNQGQGYRSPQGNH